MPAREDSGSEQSSESPDQLSESEEDPVPNRVTLHERFGSLLPPPDLAEEHQREAEVEKVRKRSTTSFAITMNEFPNPEKQHRQTSSERFGRIAATASGFPSSNRNFAEQEVSFQTQSLYMKANLSDSPLFSHPREQRFPLHNDHFVNNPLHPRHPPFRFRQPEPLQFAQNRGPDFEPENRESSGYSTLDGYEDVGPPGPRDSHSDEFDLLAMGEPMKQPWQLRQGGIAGLDKEGAGPVRIYGRGRDARGLKGKDHREARGDFYGPPMARPPQIVPGPFGGPRPGPMNGFGNPMRPLEHRLGGPGGMDMNEGPQRFLPPGPLHNPPLRPMGPPLRPMGGPMNPRMMHMGPGNPMAPNPRLMGPPMGHQPGMGPPQGPHGGPLGPHGGPLGGPLGPPGGPIGGPHGGPQIQRIFPMGGPPFRPPGPVRMMPGMPPRPVMPQPKALMPPGGWAHLPSKVVGPHAPRGVGGPRRTKPARPPLEPRSDLDADLDQYRSEHKTPLEPESGSQGQLSERGGGEARSDDEIEAPPEEDLGDIGVLE